MASGMERPAARACREASRTRSRKPAGKHHRFTPLGRHDDSSNCRSSTVSSLASASLSRDLAVPSGIPAASATSRQVIPAK